MFGLDNMVKNMADKLDQILEAIGELNTRFSIYEKLNDEKVIEQGKKLQEVRDVLWKNYGIQSKVEEHHHDIHFLKWMSGIIGAAVIAAITNSILHLVVK